MNDIVERLRNYDYRGNRPPEHAVMAEAADEIEVLRELLIDCERDMYRAQEGIEVTDDPQPIPHPGGPLDLKGQP